MTDSPASMDAAPHADPGSPPPRPPGMPTGGDRFFAWLRGLDIVRADGWVGGVCAGIAARIGIDPLIVRGVFVVAALFSLPMFLVYAVGWALLPDPLGRIHMQELIRRRFDPAMVGIGLLVLVSVFPIVPWFFGVVLPFGYIGEGSPVYVLGTLASTVVVVGVVYLIVRSSRRTPPAGGVAAPDGRTASAGPAAPSTVGGSGLGDQGAPEIDSDGDDSQLADWRAQHDAWRIEDDAWRRRQLDAERIAKEQARAERAIANAAFASEAAERRRVRRLTRPRTSGAFIALVVGAALVAGALTALGVSSLQDDVVAAVAAGLLASALVASLGMVLAGALRRRSGFLTFVAIALLIAGVATGAPTVTRGLAFGSTYVNSIEPQSFTQVWGDLTIDLAQNGLNPAPIEIVKRGGSTTIYVGPDLVANLQIRGVDSVEWSRFSDFDGSDATSGTWKSQTGGTGEPLVFRSIDTTTADSPDGEPHIVRLDQTGGTVYVEIYEG